MYGMRHIEGKDRKRVSDAIHAIQFQGLSLRSPPSLDVSYGIRKHRHICAIQDRDSFSLSFAYFITSIYPYLSIYLSRYLPQRIISYSNPEARMLDIDRWSANLDKEVLEELLSYVIHTRTGEVHNYIGR